MKVGIIGGGIAGLTAAYYIKKFALPVSQVILLESSNRFGGWINSETFLDKENNRNVLFESGPRTLRISTLHFREINTVALAKELKLENEMDLIPNTHPAARKRYIYLNGKINLFKLNFLTKSALLNKSLLQYGLKDYRTKPRSPDVKDESIYDFISRRLDSDVAEHLVDPLMKGICGGDIKELSAASLLKPIYDAEAQFGNLVGSVLARSTVDLHELEAYRDLVELKPKYTNLSVWRFKNGLQTLSDSIVKHLEDFKDVNLMTNEACMKINFNQNANKILLETTKNSYEVDFVISGLYSKHLANMLSDEHLKLKNVLNKIESVNMIVINLYFDKNVLPVEGFGYLVPTKENSPILGCIFDSVFDIDNKDHSTLTLMIGGALYDKYINEELENNHDKLLNFALNALKQHMNFDLQPKRHKISILKNCIPQYKVGHQDLLQEIDNYIFGNKLNDKLYLLGNSYNGIGVNDVIFNSRKLCQNVLKGKLSK